MVDSPRRPPRWRTRSSLEIGRDLTEKARSCSTSTPTRRPPSHPLHRFITPKTSSQPTTAVSCYNWTRTFAVASRASALSHQSAPPLGTDICSNTRTPIGLTASCTTIHGVDIGYTGRRRIRVTAPKFIGSAEEERAVSADIAKEVELGRVAGPFLTPPFPHYRCSPLKTVPKKGSANKYRTIHHLSYPHGRSINTSTADWPCPLARFSHAVDMVRRLGKGCYMAKVDVQAAYRAIPIRPADWPLLGMHWLGQYFFHRTLPFGLRSSCHLWEQYATAAEWIIINAFGVRNLLHYLDDSFIANATEEGCAADLAAVKRAMQDLGIPDAPDKTTGPETRITFLGIQIDSRQMTVSLVQPRLDSLRLLLREWDNRHTCSLRQLQSTIGTLS